MLSKEESLKKAKELSYGWHVGDNEFVPLKDVNKLIREIYSIKPYKFEDLKEVIGNPIYDEKYKEFYILSKVKEEEIYKDEGIEKFMICSDKKGLMRVFFEENRFFPIWMANVGCEKDD